MPKNAPHSPRHKRTPGQRTRDLADIAALYLQGKTQQEIARWITLNRPYSLDRSQVAYDIKHLLKLWKQAATHSIEQKKAAELARLDYLEHELWQAWEHSKQDTTRTLCEQAHPQGSGRQSASSRFAIITRTRDGDPRFLHGVLACIAQRCEILGLNQGVITNSEVPSDLRLAEETTMSSQDIDACLSRYYRESRDAAPT